MKKIRVLEVLRDAEGGMRKHVDVLVSRIDRDRFEIILAGSKGQFDRKKLQDRDITYYEINLGDRRNPAAVIKSFLDLTHIIKKEKPAIIHAHGMACATVSTACALLAGRPAIITTVHNFPATKDAGIKQRISNFLAGLSLRLCKRVVVVSKALGSCICSLWKIPEEKIRVIYNGVDVGVKYHQEKPESGAHMGEKEPFICEDISELNIVQEEITGRPCAILNIARLAPEKGVDVFIEASAIVLKKLESRERGNYEPVKPLFLIAGDGPMEHDLKKMALELGVEKRVRFLGYRKDIHSLIKAANAVVLSSRREGFGISLLEAMAFRKPVIGTCVGGIPEIIAHGETGLLVPPGNPEALADAILYILDNPREAHKMAEKGFKKVVESFSVKNMVDSIEKVFLEVVSEDKSVNFKSVRPPSGSP
ncbi:glycosyltransferase [Thermoanaerobacterium sp. DL9XJH110]|uniref:glycosyltransferase n=1 Tax=Thermoanaerobacterium sp. DL9XJH110 TaxID=3386643 RepID=UPI003BB73E71